MNADVNGALAQLEDSWKSFVHNGKRMNKKQVKAVLEYAVSKGYTNTGQLSDEEVDKVLHELEFGWLAKLAEAPVMFMEDFLIGKRKEFTGIRDWKLKDINEGSVLKTQQGTRFLVAWSTQHNRWCMVQANKGRLPNLQGDWFSLEKFMQPNLEVIGNIYDNPELLADEKIK